jgi:hypothetical protein
MKPFRAFALAVGAAVLIAETRFLFCCQFSKWSDN